MPSLTSSGAVITLAHLAALSLAFFYFFKHRMILLCLEHSSYIAYVWWLRSSGLRLQTFFSDASLSSLIQLHILFCYLFFSPSPTQSRSSMKAKILSLIHKWRYIQLPKCLVHDMFNKNLSND